MSVKFSCPKCHSHMAVNPELAGKKVRCPHCKEVVVAPAAEAASPQDAGNPFQFNPVSEDHDSIFGEVANENVVGGPPKENSPFDLPAPAKKREPKVETPAFEPAASEPVPAGDPFGVDAPATASGKTAKPPRAGSRRSLAMEEDIDRRNNWLLAIIVPYAVLMTVIAVTYFIKFQNQAQIHPLEMIPDLMGEFQRQHKKGASTTLRLPPADQLLPSRLVTSIGQPITVGMIQVTPLKIEYRPWLAFAKVKNQNDPQKKPIRDTLVMTVQLKNISDDLTFYPTDPYFDRRPKHPNDKPYTMVEVGKKHFFGGVISFETEGGEFERAWVDGQDDDNKPLKPGQSRKTVFVTMPKDEVFAAVEKNAGKSIWRIHVRRGTVEYGGESIPVSAVIGVAFGKEDVKRVS